MINKVTVLGGGCWGVTLASVISEKDVDITLWEYDREQARGLDVGRKLSSLPNHVIPRKIKITSDLNVACENAQTIIFAIPSRYVRGVAKEIALGEMLNHPLIVSVSKGIERNTLMRVSQVIASELPKEFKDRIAVISGPSHSEEVSIKVPTAVIIACQNKDIAVQLQRLFATPYFKLIFNKDVIGVELGGAIKNVIALSCGICDGLNLGDNTKAALITAGFKEMGDLAIAMGAKRETLLGLAGIGDLIVTCLSRHSRNRYLGEKIGKGKKLKEALAEMTMVAEGVDTLEAVFDLAQRYETYMPITVHLYDILFRGKEPQELTKHLFSSLYNKEGFKSTLDIQVGKKRELIREPRKTFCDLRDEVDV